MRGALIAKAIDVTGTDDGTDPNSVDELQFQVANAAGDDAVDLTPGKTILVYDDSSQVITLVSGDFTSTPLGNANTDKLVEPGELYEIKITGLVALLDPDLKTDALFTIEVKPAKGAVIPIERRTPRVLDVINNLN